MRPVTGSDDVPLVVRVRRLHPDAVLPEYARPGDAGADLVTIEDVDLAPGQRRLVGTGVAVEIPHGYAGFVHPRSGLAHRVGLGMVNAPGTIDSGYRGEIMVNLINHDPVSSIRLRAGDRIAQLVVQPVPPVVFVEADALAESARGERGHGSTGGATALTGSRAAEAH